ncbi:hypothetical protein Daus18300_012701 [Diaporthe australafricana]|uniref:Uncharacterized protein n=1 Tax=Diaporthe australafricana TaxID=127596 RepID=A0ABR3W1T4_9PEZI
MEKTTKLADLKLVNKYYPSVSNYSYPRPDATHRCEPPANGRSSVGSECSVPEMVEDQESDISIEDTSQSQIAGDETFDSFWEDSESFWGIEPGEKNNTVFIGPITHSAALQRDANRTLAEKDRHAAPQRSLEGVNDDEAEPCWPLVATEPSVAPAPKPSKPSYSLFPQQSLSQLRQSISANDFDPTPKQIPSPAESAVSHTTAPCGGASRPTTPLTQQTVMPVSVFDFDSDSDSDDDSAANFARRIVKNLTPHKRSRSASAAPRSRKGSDIAKEQLRRIRAETVASSSADATTAAADAVEPDVEDKENDGHAFPVLRRQKSEVFGTIFGRKR